jgi:hypothetical protein
MSNLVEVYLMTSMNEGISTATLKIPATSPICDRERPNIKTQKTGAKDSSIAKASPRF